MPTIVPLTPESVWTDWLAACPNLRKWHPPLLPTLVIAPHPDDETLGAGGLIARLRGFSVPVTVVAVTDGENAYADVTADNLGKIRVAEQAEALLRLDVGADQLVRLHLPDRNVSSCEERLVQSLKGLVQPGIHLVAPWPGDFHPDHEAAGRAAARVASELGLTLTYYLFWTWHRGTVSVFNDMSLLKLDLSKEEQDRKERALRAHASQLAHLDGQPILSNDLLRPARRTFEVFIQP